MACFDGRVLLVTHCKVRFSKVLLPLLTACREEQLLGELQKRSRRVRNAAATRIVTALLRSGNGRDGWVGSGVQKSEKVGGTTVNEYLGASTSSFGERNVTSVIYPSSSAKKTYLTPANPLPLFPLAVS